VLGSLMEKQPRLFHGYDCDPFAIRSSVHHCLLRTFLPSVVLHVVEFTLSSGFESLPLRHSLIAGHLTTSTAQNLLARGHHLEHSGAQQGLGELPHCGDRIRRCGFDVVVLRGCYCAVPPNALDHRIIHAQAIQIRRQTSAEPVPTMPGSTVQFALSKVSNRWPLSCAAHPQAPGAWRINGL
jgi:hypothetical protein